MYNKRAVGKEKEERAGAYLTEQGYTVIAYNYRTRRGEIDIIARDGEYLVFCEVKYRKTDVKGHASEAVDLKKQSVISKCALHYMTEHHMNNVSCRFDVICMDGTEIRLIKNAFDYIVF